MNYKIAITALVALQAYLTSALPPCACARNYVPICGSDGVTYSNDCKLQCEKFNAKSDLTKVSDGPCPDTPDLPVCICTFEYKPVCGNDGVTYSNNCALRCTKPINPKIATAYEGECTDKVKVEVPCICTDDLNEVCGSDGKTYANACGLNCATAKDPSLSIAHSGKCPEKEDSLPTPPTCTCVRNLKPVCGSDGKTYSNDCLLNCATASDPSLSIAHSGKCPENEGNLPIPPFCTCMRDLKPVCGSDGTTYSNDCLLNCATASDPSLSIAHPGNCGDVNVVNN